LEIKETLKNVLNPKKNELDRKGSPLAGVFELPDKFTSSYPDPVYKS